MQEPRWQEALAQHGTAVREFITAAAAIPVDQWTNATAEKKWSAAAITQHLQLVYDGSLRELKGGGGIRVRPNWIVQRFLRAIFMRRILRTGRFPERVAAPRELRPELIDADQAAALALLAASASEFETLLNALRAVGGSGLTHHLFGRLSSLDGLRLVTTHLQHHRRQLS